MVTQVWSAAVQGVESVLVRVEVNVASGLPTLAVVGLPQGAVREGRDRVQAALRAVGHALPPRRITVNLAPGDLKKEGSGFDLPMAVALLAACEVFPSERLADHAFLGELGLAGEVRGVRGVLPVARRCREDGVGVLVVPRENVAEALAIGGRPRVFGVGHLRELVAHFRSGEPLPDPGSHAMGGGTPAPVGVELRDIRGQRAAKRALEVAAAGGHHLLLVGSPGVGKTLLARAVPGILPPLSRDEALEATAIHSVAGLLPPGCGLLSQPPFRAPHHSVSTAGLVGGGRPPRPGEVSLAHRGVLFLDEIGEFSRAALESLRQPLEDGVVSVVRAEDRRTFPSRFSLVAATNPCPCGRLGAGMDAGEGSGRAGSAGRSGGRRSGGRRSGGDPSKGCTCDPLEVARYRSRISGPLRDRIDLQVETSPVPLATLMGEPEGPSSAEVRERVTRAREIQRRRFGGRTKGNPHTRKSMNAHMGPGEIRRFVEMDGPRRELLESAVERFHLSPRGVHRVLRVARTLADLEGCENVGAGHLGEALQYRIPGGSSGG